MKSLSNSRKAQAATIKSLIESNFLTPEKFMHGIMTGDIGTYEGGKHSPAPLKLRMEAANWIDERIHGKLPDAMPDPFDGLTEREMLKRLKVEVDKRWTELDVEQGQVV